MDIDIDIDIDVDTSLDTASAGCIRTWCGGIRTRVAAYLTHPMS